jgi:polyhydroxybutyrate depolymerase
MKCLHRSPILHLILALFAGVWSVAAHAQQDIYLDFGRGPEVVHLPPQIESGEPLPLVVMLHGYGSTSLLTDMYLGFTAESDRRGFILVRPNGEIDVYGNRHWNATDACCQYFGDRDDSSYLRGIIDKLVQRFSIDPARIYVTGHSNGGFMSHRMACDHADVVAAVASIAGATWAEPGLNCAPTAPVAVLQIHGTLDPTILYPGGCLALLDCYPGARFTAASWALLNSCSGAPVPEPGRRDFAEGVAGPESLIENFTGCADGGASSLWTLRGASHVPIFTPAFLPAMVDFLYANARD